MIYWKKILICLTYNYIRCFFVSFVSFFLIWFGLIWFVFFFFFFLNIFWFYVGFFLFVLFLIFCSYFCLFVLFVCILFFFAFLCVFLICFVLLFFFVLSGKKKPTTLYNDKNRYFSLNNEIIFLKWYFNYQWNKII